MPYITDNEWTIRDMIEIVSENEWKKNTVNPFHSYWTWCFMLQRSSQSSWEKCIRVWYDFYECPCKKCIDLDIERESITKAERNKKDFWKELISFMRKEWLFFWNKGSHQKIKEFLSSNWFL